MITATATTTIEPSAIRRRRRTCAAPLLRAAGMVVGTLLRQPFVVFQSPAIRFADHRRGESMMGAER